MKVIYKVIKEWSSLSGVHYVDINSADICDEASAKVFKEWCCEKVSYGPLSIYLANSHQGHEKMKAFHNKGWGYLSLMEEIFPEGRATGGRAHRGTAASGNSHIAYMHLTTLISYLNSLKPNMLYK